MRWFMSCLVLILPFLMARIGRGWKNNPPGQINGVYGYRTRWSGKSQETWDYAHQRIAALWIKTGVVLLVSSVAALAACWVLAAGELFYILSAAMMLVQTAVMLGTIFPVEKGLREHFDEEGKRIQ